jgi:hypothetical protein
MLQDHKTINDNNLMTAVNMIMSRFDRLEGKKVDYVDLTAYDSASKKFCVLYSYYDKVFMQRQTKPNWLLQHLKPIRPI